ncbi:hypothetical protein [Egicoccus halophilus]|uniref:Hpr(Ser) kinase/phosphatase n=1 Tax=Egicoccus halophilus TaxID=1670830 RepID=A0A8J3AC69_9ACTN|nr:hypothetical protein [Egicoccus halophilus]GGI03991.1 hypothetical protein GCM10011354_06820 [Egicoccus halophilus]
MTAGKATGGGATGEPRIGPFLAVAHAFTVVTDEPSLTRHLDTVLAPLATASTTVPTSHYRLAVRARPATLHADDRLLIRADEPSRPLAHLLHAVNEAARRSTSACVLHAAVADRGDGAVVFAAASESGKSTLVRALVDAGWGYLSDEYAIVHDDLTVQPYARPISLDPGSWQLFAQHRPDPPPAVTALLPDQWQLPVPDPVRERRPVRAVVLPRHVPGAASRLVPVAPLDAVRLLLGCSFSRQEQPGRDLALLSRLAHTVAVARLQVDGLTSAVDVLRNVGRARSPGHQQR